MDYKTNLVLHISFLFFFLFLAHCLKSIVFLISFMDFLINKLYLVSCIFRTYAVLSIFVTAAWRCHARKKLTEAFD